MVSTAAFHARVQGSVPGLKEIKLFLPHPRGKVSIVGSLRDREVACSASDRQGSNFESRVWRTVSSQSSHHPQEVHLAQFSLYVHKGALKPDSFHFLYRLCSESRENDNPKAIYVGQPLFIVTVIKGKTSWHHDCLKSVLSHDHNTSILTNRQKNSSTVSGQSMVESKTKRDLKRQNLIKHYGFFCPTG